MKKQKSFKIIRKLQ